MEMLSLKCKSCDKKGISLLDTLAYAANGQIRCKNCGALFKLKRVSSFLYLLCEGASILITVYYSFYLSSAWPLGLVIIFFLIFRSFMLYSMTGIQKSKRLRTRKTSKIE